MNSENKRNETAAEFMARLNKDPAWVKRQKELEAKRCAKEAQLRAELEPEEKPLLNELAALGYKVQSVWKLVNSATSYPAAIPILLKHLRMAHHPKLREGIARALTSPEARGVAGPVVLSELQRPSSESPHSVRWALANALTVVADESMVDEIKMLIADSQYADVRERLMATLEKIAAR